MKAIYVLLSIGALGLLFIEAPTSKWLTSTPERGKVERKTPRASGSGSTVRAPMFIFLSGYHGGK
ncbi:hypothetical protein PPSIR1_42221 [Plesiocystis pacifica SIR-1]|uniref:Uncharacterized protein n=1 Tax=Plesiocystis pacifica SIR-1 TaxID=391625 RepID=A6GD00_9BACT|nr:hypothetical protein [Plesiocystis pacifica]EDM76238.1 hypothetical protein PPSIR1_42221 [Plesiocystis pacifica SIR-1]